jgi:hypothetical protein
MPTLFLCKENRCDNRPRTRYTQAAAPASNRRHHRNDKNRITYTTAAPTAQPSSEQTHIKWEHAGPIVISQVRKCVGVGPQPQMIQCRNKIPTLVKITVKLNMTATNVEAIQFTRNLRTTEKKKKKKHPKMEFLRKFQFEDAVKRHAHC